MHWISFVANQMTKTIVALCLSFLGGGLASSTDVRPIDTAVSIRAHRDSIKAIALSKVDKRLVATSSDDGEIALWDLQTMSPYWKAYLADFSTQVAFSSSGRMLVTGSQCHVMLLNIHTGMPIMTFATKDPRHPNSTGCNINWDEPDLLVFDKQDHNLFVGFADRVFHFNLLNGALEGLYGDPFRGGERFWGLMDMGLSNDERYLFTLDEAGFKAYLIAQEELVREMKFSEVPGLSHIQSVRRGGLAGNGEFVVFADDIFIYVVNTVFKRVEQKIMAATDRITSTAFTDDLCCFILSSADGTIRIYDIATGEELSRLDDNRPSRDRNWQTASAAATWSDIAFTGDAEGRLWIWRP